jgi:hypothetical protein
MLEIDKLQFSLMNEYELYCFKKIKNPQLLFEELSKNNYLKHLFDKFEFFKPYEFYISHVPEKTDISSLKYFDKLIN